MLSKGLRISMAVIGLLSIAGLKSVSTVSSATYSMPFAEFYPAYAPCSFDGTQNAVYPDGTSSGCMLYQAGVHLPNGITVNQVTIHYFDDDPGSITVYFMRTDLNGNTAVLNTWSSSSNAGTFRTETIPVTVTIDNATYGYYFQVMVMPGTTTNIRLGGITLDSSYPAFLPSILK